MSSNNSGKRKNFADITTRPPSFGSSQRLGANSSTRRLEGAMVVPYTSVSPNFFQARQEFDQEALAELASDIRERGILEPLIVRELEPGQYQIIAGERRYLAAHQAELTELPVIVRQMDDREARFATLAENLQRQDLSPLDEQRYFQLLQNEYNLSIRDIARLINKSKGYVENRLEGKLQELVERPSQGQKLQTSQAAPRVAQYNPAVYKRVSNFFDNTLQILESKPDKETVAKIRESVADARQKLEELEKKLAETGEETQE